MTGHSLLDKVICAHSSVVYEGRPHEHHKSPLPSHATSTDALRCGTETITTDEYFKNISSILEDPDWRKQWKEGRVSKNREDGG